MSAYSTRRPALQEMPADAKAKKFELVLVYKIDRFSRNRKDLEEELENSVALQEVREIEHERSKDYPDRVGEFISGYDPDKKVVDLETKKLILNPLFKNIKIVHNPAGKLLLRGEFFAHFNFFYFDKLSTSFFEKKQKCQAFQNKRVAKLLPKKSSSGPSDVR